MSCGGHKIESYIPISFLNDFVFCPRSIYFHLLYSGFDDKIYKSLIQIKGEGAHLSIDNKVYTTKKEILQSFEVYSSTYNLFGKIDIYNIKTGKLIERKRQVKTIYDGYVFQVYAQCHSLREMGYEVNEIVIHDLIHNKNYNIDLPENNKEMQDKFENLIRDINQFDLEKSSFKPTLEKCKNCIYRELCDYSLC